MITRKTKSRIAIILSVTLFGAAIAIISILMYLRQCSNPSPSPSGFPIDLPIVSSVETGTSDGFPEVDWDYWLGINPDIVGWITIEGTNINHPIVAASQDDPDYYLHHDVYGNCNPLGAVYLDADSVAEGGLDSRNAVIAGHHGRGLNGITAFEDVTNYLDKSFAEGHAIVLIQTPTEKRKYEIRFAGIVKGSEHNKFTQFADDAAFKEWYDAQKEAASMTLDTDTEPDKVISLVSCSYTTWAWNERTVVIASEL